MKNSIPYSNISAAISISILVLAFSSNLQAATLYKWVDKHGNISYQDQPPPENAKILKEDTITEESKTNPKTVANKGGNTEPVLVYTLADCPNCESLISRLAQMGVPTEVRALSEDPDAQRRILEQSGGVTAPTLFLGNKIITDTNPSTLPTQLENAGYVLNEETTQSEVLNKETTQSEQALDPNSTPDKE